MFDAFSVGKSDNRKPSDSRWAMLSVIFDDKSEINMTPDEMLKLAENIYEGMSEEDIAEMEKVMLDRSNFFDQNRIFELLEGVTDETLAEAVNLLAKSNK